MTVGARPAAEAGTSTPRPRSHDDAQHPRRPRRRTRPARGAGGAGGGTVLVAPATVVYAEAFPTGDGPGDEEVCANFGYRIDSQMTLAGGYLADGEWGQALEALEAASKVADMAEDAGCVVIY